MAMLPCKKCLENIWSFEELDSGEVKATCKMCGNEVQWLPKVKSEMKAGDSCRKCKAKIILKETKRKPSQLKKPYYYTAIYMCPKCKTLYLSDRFKVINKI